MISFDDIFEFIDKYPMRYYNIAMGNEKKEFIMSKKSKGLPKKLRDGYKKLPLKERVKILVKARKVLERQREGKGKNVY